MAGLLFAAQGSYRDMLLLKDTLSNGSASPPSSPLPASNGNGRTNGHYHSRGLPAGSPSKSAAASGGGGLTRARSSAETVRRQVDSLERELRELVLMPPAALAVAPRQLAGSSSSSIRSGSRPMDRSGSGPPPPSPAVPGGAPGSTAGGKPSFGSLALEAVEGVGAALHPPHTPGLGQESAAAEVSQMLADCGLGRYTSVLAARGLLSAESLGALGMGELGGLGLDTTEKIALKRVLRHAYGFGSPSPRGGGGGGGSGGGAALKYSTNAVGGEV